MDGRPLLRSGTARIGLAALVALALLLTSFAVRPATAPAVQGMTGPLAKFYVKKALKTELGKRYTFGKQRKIGPCKRINRQRMRCKVSWINHNRLHKGHVTVWFRRNQKWGYKMSIDWKTKL